jgi:predicted deacylase
MHTGIVHHLDLERDGKVLDWLSIPFSIDRSPYFLVKVPICVIRNGSGPSLLLMAGNHGDEYEGELSLARLLRRLDPAQIRGRVTILPMANTPAVMAAKRCSPLDGGNLNRAFPGDPKGMPTSRLAYFLEKELFPRHDVVFDIHSGGTSMEHLPVALIERDDDVDRHRRTVDLMKALAMPHGFIADNGAAAPTSLGAARRARIIGLSGEFGGGGTATVESMAITARAIDNLLMALGVIDSPVLGTQRARPESMRMMSLARHSQGIYATRRGWFEPAVYLGDRVAAGQLAGWYHDLERLDVVEEELRFAEEGIVISRRLHTMCEAGDCLLQAAELIDEA